MKQILLTLFCFYSIWTFSQTAIPIGWHTLDLKQDSFYGISLNKAYDFLHKKNIKPNKVIVAVLDSGCDTLQEDLKNILWHNPKEIPNNHIDDDKNGYVDDIYGWNFLGNKNGENLKVGGDERTRVFYRFKEQFSGKKIDSASLSAKEKQQYILWKQASNELNISSDEEFEIGLTDMALQAIKKYDKVLRTEMGVEEYTTEYLEKFEAKTPEAKQNKYNYLTTVKLLGIDADEKNLSLISQLEEYVETKKRVIKDRASAPPNYRATIVQDDYNNINDKYYGNPDVTALSPRHGTHVSGIIAAQRGNNLGIDGIADNAKIMVVRIVPEGDEYDKDIALAIFYAVNNGAKVINMSFGKGLSPEKYWIDSAIRYAEKKDVLLIHAAGNDSRNTDSIPSFPTPYFQNSNINANNFITVGASTDPKVSKGNIVADFSNYGKNSVNVYAPGVKIYSTVPGVSNYSYLQGTSMAAPIVSGLAALLRGYFPSLTAIQTKEVIEKSVFKPNETTATYVVIGDEQKERITINNSCTSGGIVNAANAVELAFRVDAANKKNNLNKGKK